MGGGHAHVQVLRRFGMAPAPGIRLTIVSREIHTPYSGMLPGLVAGNYGWRDIHIDLGPLARFAGARLIQGEVSGLDLASRRIQFADRPDLHFDLLSINVGAVPAVADRSAIAVKPIGRFFPQWRRLRGQLADGDRLLLLGLGAGAVELALAAREALGGGINIGLIGNELMPGMRGGVQKVVRRALAAANIELLESEQIEQASAREVHTRSGRVEKARWVVDVTGVRAPAWLADSGLLVDEAGFVRVDGYLRSLSHPFVYAAGDAASLDGQPRPKSGVYAVRAGPVLHHNLRFYWHPPARQRRFHAQRQALALLGLGGGRALGMRGVLRFSGRWVWRYKQWIDRRFMDRFTRLPQMVAPESTLPVAMAADAPDPMRCGGCGAKLAAQPLRRVLAQLPPASRSDIVQGIGDDAAVIAVGQTQLALTVDGFSAFIDDAYRFARIATHHALNDVYAMGGEPHSALVMATVPTMSQTMMENELLQLMRGVTDVLQAEGAELIGGHSNEGPQLALGLTVTGHLPQAPVGKGELSVGDRLICTKPIGTGVLLAGAMRGEVPSDQLESALVSMDCSNRRAVGVLREHGVHALTDITGFGLLGHLAEMLRAAGYGAHVRSSNIPLFQGVIESFSKGLQSSLQGGNEAVLADFGVDLGNLDTSSHARIKALVDPQTSGGLLAAVPADQASSVIPALIEAGYTGASVVGEVVDGPSRILDLNL